MNLVTIGEFEADGRRYPLFLVEVGKPEEGKAEVMIAAGIHGDEPAGVEAALAFLETRAHDPALLVAFQLRGLPLQQPDRLGARHARELARDRPEPAVSGPQARAGGGAMIMQALQGRCFDLVFEMHEDVDSPGLYLYEIAENSDDHVGEAIIEAARASGCPINMNPVIEGLPADGGITRRKINLKRFRKTRLCRRRSTLSATCGGHVITLEPPASVLPLEERVRIELASLEIALDRTG